ncbi:unnamed protein product [Hermetia illucens]|uniref:Right handed beta helix domain-containing protein n=1 Tax=Hermetia illucens TaxID=343691 RepID=A0A7R8YZY3_HERIL|nr:uncharacterized protein LOC119658385 [Hermetia illucens]CAD7090981.1 unnamed protein product [Hermetia illucens]
MALLYHNLYNARFPATIFVLLTVLGTLHANTAGAGHYSSSPVYAHFGYSNSSSAASTGSSQLDTSAKDVSNTSLFVLHRQKRTDKEDLCESKCKCEQRPYFLAVECDLNRPQEYTFGTKNFIPPKATSFAVKLAAKAKLRIEADFFKETRVNKILIEGPIDPKSVQIEFRTNASTKSIAPNPEITIRNCHTLVLREYSIGGDIKLKIQNCTTVIFFKNALNSAKFHGEIEDVEDLRIAELAFDEAQGKIDIYRSFIENLYSLQGIFRQIAFYNCTIGNITGKTFNVLEINAIIFDNCRIGVINTNAITEKVWSKNLQITGGYIGVIERKAIDGSGITELILSNNHIDTIQEKAIRVFSINATITNNRILLVDKEWMEVKEWTNFIVSNNTFGKFSLMTLDKRNNKSVKCIFEKNLITLAMPGSLNLTNKNCMIREIAFGHDCKCLKYDNWLEKLTSRDIRSESYCTIKEDLKFCFNRTQLNVLKYENEVCSESSETLDCMKQNNLKFIDGEFIKPQEFERRKINHWYYIIGACIVLVILIIILIIVFAIFTRKRKSIMTREFDENAQSLTNRGRFSKEDRRVIKQTMETVKQNYSHDIYKELDKHVQSLLKEDIDETELVQTIALIVPILHNCENSGDSFVAFTAILGKLLQPADDDLLDPVYAEPQLPDRVIYNQIPEGQTEVEHIYTEPLSVQQPLLTNEYATPADRNEATAVYAEPIGIDKASNLIPPYAAVTPRRTLTDNMHNSLLQQPSTSHNLPDVLNSLSGRKPMTNVQKLAENFSNNPKFHINRSPTTNRRIPQYTIPNKDRTPGPSRPNTRNNPSSLETSSNHSGSSDITVKIDDIDYADA